MKTEKKRERPIEHESSVPNPIKPMERKKKRKAMDKEKHHSSSSTTANAVNAAELKGKLIVPVETPSSSSNIALPEFHIGVFKELGSADFSVRVAAAERLVTELQDVQKAYDKLDKKKEIENELKLEAEKDDGLNNSAPSVRYAVRRLIRGVSSSREVCFGVLVCNFV